MSDRINEKAAKETVFGNLGLDEEDLGVDKSSEALGQDDGDEEQEQQQAGRPSDTSEDDGLSERRAPKQEQQQRQRPGRDQFGRPRQRETRAEGRGRFDAKGNIVDGAGKVVAKAGAEARLYQRAHQATTQLQAERTRSQDLTSRLTRAVELGTEAIRRHDQLMARDEHIRQMGITPAEQLEAFRFVQMAKSDPAGALKAILAKAVAQGVDLTQIGLAGNSAIDPKSVLDLVRQEIGGQLQPLRQEQAARQQQNHQRQQSNQELRAAEGQVNQFLIQNPEAREYLPVIHEALKVAPQMTLGELWARLQLHLERRRTPQRQRPRGLPNGRGSVPATGSNGMASTEMSYDQILRDVINEVGLPSNR